MKTAAAALLFLFAFTNTFAQKDSILKVEQTDNRRFIYLTVTRIDTGAIPAWNYYLRTYQNEVETVFSLDSLFRNSCHGWPAAERNLQFLNDSTGYLYGYTIGYGYCSYIFKTTNGGRTWQSMPLTGSYNTLSEQEFYMFNERQGIAFPAVVKDTLTWKITSDGGMSWQGRQTKLGGLKHEGVIRPVYSSEGNVLFILERPWFKGRTSKIFGVIQSTNFGKSFRLLQ